MIRAAHQPVSVRLHQRGHFNSKGRPTEYSGIMMIVGHMCSLPSSDHLSCFVAINSHSLRLLPMVSRTEAEA